KSIDPSAQPGSGVEPIPLLEADGEFDAAVAVVSLHHVEPLAESLAHLAGLLVPGARLVIDELDVDRCDEPALRWWLAQRTALRLGAPHDDAPDADARKPEEIVAEMRAHIHTLETVRATLSTHFEIGESVRGAYLHRWALAPSLREPELEQIAEGRIPAVGARMVAIRR
ncbi:MAG: class I SAM-dependent methyltransferase, partial [Solirubrobacteraceae bacterium]